jgi:predicted DNA-binding protein YlxM (UPF0122 family)
MYFYEMVNKQKLQDLYLKKSVPMKKIALMYGVDKSTVRYALIRNNIPIRSVKEVNIMSAAKKRKIIKYRKLNNGCIITTNIYRTSSGYPVVSIKNYPIRLSRFVYCKKHKIKLDDIKGLVVRHSCDNPKCVNPEHLLIGTNADNSRDMVVRGRNHRGENVHNSKLTNKNALKIKSLLSQGKLREQDIADKFGVSKSAINSIRNKRNWVYI